MGSHQRLENGSIAGRSIKESRPTSMHMLRIFKTRKFYLWLTCTFAALVLLTVILGSTPDGPTVITPPPNDAEPGRWVHLEGAANTRDAGNYQTRDGRHVRSGAIYRSGKLNKLTDEGVRAFRSLHIKTVIDFCNRLTPWPLFNGDVWGVQLVSSVKGCPVSFSSDETVEDHYIIGVESNADEFRDAFELLADPDNYPVLYHCAAGTDRTGAMSALLLSLLDVDRETIIADFRLSEKVHRPGNLPAIQALLKHIDEQGGIRAYLESIGVSADVQRRIRDNLLTSP